MKSISDFSEDQRRLLMRLVSCIDGQASVSLLLGVIKKLIDALEVEVLSGGRCFQFFISDHLDPDAAKLVEVSLAALAYEEIISIAKDRNPSCCVGLGESSHGR